MANINSARFISIALILILNANGIAANSNTTESFDAFDDTTGGDYCKWEDYYNVAKLARETLRICVQNKPTFAVYDQQAGAIEIQLVETIARELKMNVVYQFVDEKLGVCSER